MENLTNEQEDFLLEQYREEAAMEKASIDCEDKLRLGID